MEKKPEEEAILNNIETSLTGLSQSLLELGVAASEVPPAEESESKEGESSRVVSDKVLVYRFYVKYKLIQAY